MALTSSSQLERSFDAGTYKFDIQDKAFKMKDYLDFVNSPEVSKGTETFRKKQAEAIAKTSQKESKLLKEWEEGKAKEAASGGGSSSSAQSAFCLFVVHDELTDHALAVDASAPAIEASMNASIWKIKVKPGDVIKSVDDVVRSLSLLCLPLRSS